jgi:arylsulfatase A-like enzyme
MKSDKHTHINALTRREFLKSTALGTAEVMGGLLPGCSALQSSTKAGRGRPNVLFIICDDLNDTVDGMGGHPQAKTPNIKRLMRRGVHFTNAHCNGPICAPSRASLWTGLYPSTTGYYGYEQQENHWRRFDILSDARTMMEHFRDNGYDVYGTGKIFHNGHEDNTVWHRPDGFNGLGVKPSFGPFPWDGKSRHPWGAMKGTGHSSMPPSMRDNYWGSFAALSDIPVTPADLEKGIPGYTGWMLDREPFRYVSEKDRDLMPDELNAKWAVERLQDKHKRPFFLAVGMNRPHVPRYAPKKHFDMFPLQDVQLPPYLKNDLEDSGPPGPFPICLRPVVSSFGNDGSSRIWRVPRS